MEAGSEIRIKKFLGRDRLKKCYQKENFLSSSFKQIFVRIHLFCYTQNSVILENLFTVLFNLKPETNNNSLKKFNYNHLTNTADFFRTKLHKKDY